MTDVEVGGQDVLALIDGAASGRVFLLQRARVVPGAVEVVVAGGQDVEAIATALVEGGFVRRGHRFARLGPSAAGLVAVLALDRWGLPASEVARLLGSAQPVAGTRWMAVPQLPDELLILCARLDELPDVLPVERRAALHRVLAEGGNAWVAAAQRSREWRVTVALDTVKAAYDEGRTITRRDRRRAARARGELSTPRDGAVIAISGLDGAGKSTQAHALAATLHELGLDASVRWTRLGLSRVLTVLAAPVKLLLVPLRRRRPPEGVQVRTYRGSIGADEDSLPTATDLVARDLRARLPLVHAVWTAIVAVVNAIEQRAAIRPGLQAGRIVICDRYLLDSVAHLRYRYGAGRANSTPERLLRALSPDPVVAIFLDLDPAEAYRRKPEEYDVAELAAQAEQYRAAAGELDAVVLDATADPATLARRIAVEVWSRLPD